MMATRWQQGYPHLDSWTRQDWLAAPANTIRVDPYLVWAEATDYVDLGGRPGNDGWVSIIIELSGITAEEFDTEMTNLPANQPSAGPWIKIHPLYLTPVAGGKFTRFCTAIVKKRFFEVLIDPANPVLRTFIRRFEPGEAIVSQAEIEPHRPARAPINGYISAGPNTPVVGIIDEGLAFAHER